MRARPMGRTVAALVLMVLAACGTRDTPGAPAARARVRVSITPHLSFAPLMIAKADSLFAAEGLDVEFVNALRSEETLAALLTDDIDVRAGPIHAGAISAIVQGARIRIVAGQSEIAHGGCTYFGIVVRPGLDAAKPGAIKRIRASQDGVTRFIASRMLATHNVDMHNMESLRIPEAVMVNSLERGSIDAVAVSEPALTRVAKSGTMWLKAQDVVPGFQWGVLMFGDRLVNREHDVGLRFLRAYNRGVERFAAGKTARNVAIIAAETGEPEDAIREACWPTFRAGSGINWESIAQFQQWAHAEGFMERVLAREQVWDSTFVTALAAESRKSTQ